MNVLRQSATFVWLLLVGATLVSWRLGTDHGLFFDDRIVAGSLVLLIAFVKVALVGAHFMELRRAPIPLVAVFTAWSVLVCAGLITYYAVA